MAPHPYRSAENCPYVIPSIFSSVFRYDESTGNTISFVRACRADAARISDGRRMHLWGGPSTDRHKRGKFRLCSFTVIPSSTPAVPSATIRSISAASPPFFSTFLFTNCESGCLMSSNSCGNIGKNQEQHKAWETRPVRLTRNALLWLPHPGRCVLITWLEMKLGIPTAPILIPNHDLPRLLSFSDTP